MGLTYLSHWISPKRDVEFCLSHYMLVRPRNPSAPLHTVPVKSLLIHRFRKRFRHFLDVNVEIMMDPSIMCTKLEM